MRLAPLLILIFCLCACSRAPSPEQEARDYELDKRVDPGPPPDAEGYVYCRLLQDRVKQSDCDYYEEIWLKLMKGEAAYDAPEEMVRGETATVSFAVTRAPKTEPAKKILGSKPDKTSEMKVGRRMAALLQGEGFKISPSTLQERDLFVGNGARWQWQITALKAPRHGLTLTAYVMIPSPEGRKEVLIRTYQTPVKVKVTLNQRAEDFADASEAWIKRGNNWLAALAALIATASALWLAIRRFGKKPGGENADAN